MSHEERIADALKTLAELVLAPYLAGMADPLRTVEVIETTLTKTQAARAIGVSTRTLDRLAKAGRIRATGAGKAVRYERSEIDRYLKANQRE